MTLWLLYNKNDAEKNKAYIAMYEQACRKRRISFRLVYSQDLAIGVADGNVLILEQNRPANLPRICICRDRDSFLSRQLEQAGVLVFNNWFVSEICNDKAKTYQYLANRGIPMMDSCFCTKESYGECFPYPVVVKSCSGHGGTEVFLVHDREEYKQACSRISSQKIVVQKAASRLGKDLRVYVLGKEILAAVLRQSDRDFRSNFSLGGRAAVVELSREERRLVEQITGLFSFGLAGIDLIYDKGRPVLNEIEDVVGARMLYQTTGIDLVGRYLDFVLEKESERNDAFGSAQ